jgi:hypothetical protein
MGLSEGGGALLGSPRLGPDGLGQCQLDHNLRALVKKSHKCANTVYKKLISTEMCLDNRTSHQIPFFMSKTNVIL